MVIKSAEFVISNSRVEKCPTTGLPEYAFIGRSNVGKSSLINMLTARKGLAMTSQKPGKTQLINHFIINDAWYLVDHASQAITAVLAEAGIAVAGEVDEVPRIIEDYVLERKELVLLFVLLDCRHEPQKIDLEFIQWLGEEGVPFALVFTKADKLSKGRLAANVEAYKAKLHEEWEELPPIFVTSSEERMGRDELLGYIEEINTTL